MPDESTTKKETDGAAAPPNDVPGNDLKRVNEDPVAQWVVGCTALLVLLCIGCAMYLCRRVINGAFAEHPSELVVRLLLSCIGCFIAMGFAALGFGLFLLRARGAFSASVDSATRGKGSLESNAPGLIVIVCATVVFVVSLRVHFEETTVSRPARATETSNPAGAPAINATNPPAGGSASLAQLPSKADGVEAP